MTDTAEQQAITTEIQGAVRHSAIYGLGSMLAKAAGFLMLPFYTHYLKPLDYGVLEILDLSMSLCGMFLNMGIAAALLRYYGNARSDNDKRRAVSTGFLFVLFSGGSTFVAALWLVQPISARLFGPGIPPKYLLLSFASLTMGYIANLPRTYLRAIEASRAFVMIDNVSNGVMLLLNIIFIAVLRIGLMGILLSSLLVIGVQAVVLSGWTLRRVGVGFSRPLLRRMISFGLPLILSNLAAFTLNFSDRFFLKTLCSLELVGIYAVGYKFGFMLNYLLMQPFCAMWEPRRYVIYRQANHPAVFGQIFVLYGLALTAVWLGMAMFSPEIVLLMVDARFRSSQGVIPVVGFAYVLWGIGYHSQLGMLLVDKTKLIGVISLAAVMVNVALNYFLIIHLGMMGAAWATLLSFGAIAVGSYWCSQRVFPLPLGGARVAAGMAMGVGIYFLSRFCTVNSIAVTVGIKGFLMVLFPLLLWKGGILSRSEIGTLVLTRKLAARNLSRLVARCSGTVANL